MITEDYVSYETAKLLKEKGFDEATFHDYDEKGRQWFEEVLVNHNSQGGVACPTLQMAMKWLRAEKKLYINIWADPKDAEHNNFEIVYRMTVFSGNSNFGTHEFPSYEEAAEAGIKYCLEKLI